VKDATTEIPTTPDILVQRSEGTQNLAEAWQSGPLCSALPVEAVIITPELDRRPVRSPDFQADSQVLLALMRALQNADADLWQKLAETALKVCRAHSAGVTIDEEGQGRGGMRCQGAAGRLSAIAGYDCPREEGPCGTVLDRRAPILVASPERHFIGMKAYALPIVEMLIVPLAVGAATVGTLWVMAHDDTRRFDREDLRLLTNLSECACVVYQVLQRRVQVQAALARERVGSQLLQAISAGLMREAEPNALYKQILDAATTIMSAEFASMQMVDEGELHLVECKGFHPDSVRFFERVNPTFATSCARTLSTGQRSIIADTEKSELLAGRAELEEFRRSGLRAMLSTPLLCRSGELVGVLTTHWRVPHEPSAEELRLLDVLARLAADLMERARTDQALRESDRRKNEFLAMLSHELRNPLAPITTGLELLCRPDNKPEMIQSIHGMMRRQVSHLTRLVNDLLDLSRITRGTIELKRAPLELRVVIEAAIELARPLIDQRQHNLVLEQACCTLPVDGDLERLTQVVSNVLSNAARYTDPEGRIHLRVASEAGQAVIRIRDSGLGIPDGKLEEVFEMFAQVPEHRARSGGGGLGIGLALSRRLVELHGGAIWATSSGLGHGSEFVIRLPLATSTSVADEMIRERSPVAQPGRQVLIIEDNVDAANALRLALESFGHAVQVAHDGPSGLAKLEELAPEVVLLDIGLPGMDGYEAARRLRTGRRGRDVLLVAVTGWGQKDDRERARAVGFDAHLTKPATLEELRAVMATKHESAQA
jgi:signal transduction histidine kinase/CheY-like chemotaxis protein